MQAYSLLTPLLISPSGFSLNYSESLFRMAYILSVPLQFGNQNVNVLAPVFLPFFFFSVPLVRPWSVITLRIGLAVVRL